MNDILELINEHYAEFENLMDDPCCPASGIWCERPAGRCKVCPTFLRWMSDRLEEENNAAIEAERKAYWESWIPEDEEPEFFTAE